MMVDNLTLNDLGEERGLFGVRNSTVSKGIMKNPMRPYKGS